jgi:fatty acid desaturase
MGEAKRRAIQGLPPRAPKPAGGRATDTTPRLVSWLPFTRGQADDFVRVSTRGAWIGIAALVLFWVTVRFIGPAAGWWTLADG